MDVISRQQWKARPPKRQAGRITQIKGLAGHWNGPPMRLVNANCSSTCYQAVRNIQRFHQVTRGWLDIAYSFLVCPHGKIFEGRGWGVRTAAQGTTYGNTHYHAVMYLAGDGEPLTEAAKRGLRAVYDESRRRYGGKFRPHSWFNSTICPGSEMRRWIEDGAKVSGSVSPPSPKSPPAVVEPEPEPEPIDPWEELLMALNDKQKQILIDFLEAAEADGSATGQGMFTAIVRDHRARRDADWVPEVDYSIVKKFVDAVEDMNSSPHGLAKFMVALIREARARGWDVDPEAFLDNRVYTEKDVTNRNTVT